MKNLFSKLLMAVLTFVLLGNAMAATNDGTITVNNAVLGKEYGIYRIFDATLNGSGNDAKVSYTINSDWINFFKAGAVGESYIVADSNETASLSAIVDNGVLKRINVTEQNIAAFAKAAQEYCANLRQLDSKEATSTTVEFTNLAYGYYLVFPYSASGASDGNASMVSLTTTTPTARISAKAVYPEIIKEVDEVSVEVGQTVTYTITVNVPDVAGNTKYTYLVTDTMESGLTFDGLNSIHVYLNEINSNNEITSSFEKKANGNGFKIDFNIIGGIANKTFAVGDNLLVVYTATVNENAINTVAVNKANLTYGNNPSGSEEKTPDTETVNYSTKIEVLKVDGVDKQTTLAGAKFVLKKVVDNKTLYYKWDATDKKVEWIEELTNDEDEYIATVKETGTDGKISFDGIKDGVYYLEEIEAPEGYNKLTDDVEVNVSRETVDKETIITSTSKTIENNSGTLLPETGGTGTTLFVVIGSLIALLAALVIVTNKRMANETL